MKRWIALSIVLALLAAPIAYAEPTADRAQGPRWLTRWSASVTSFFAYWATALSTKKHGGRAAGNTAGMAMSIEPSGQQTPGDTAEVGLSHEPGGYAETAGKAEKTFSVEPGG